METKIRLNKFLAERLGVSRREADELIAAGKITINGKKAVLGERLQATWTGDAAEGGPPRSVSDVGEEAAAGPVQQPKIRYNGKPVPFDVSYTYLALNKPIGYVCSRRAQGKAPTIYDLLPKKYHNLKTVGRLDKDSSGLILLTNDGNFAFQMTHPKFHKEKVYEVELDKPLQPLHQQMISDYGVMLDDGPSKFTVIKNDKTWTGDAAEGGPPRSVSDVGEEAAAGPVQNYTVILTEGRNRQIRRTFAALGYTVTRLHRIKFGKYELSGLASGKCAIIEP